MKQTGFLLAVVALLTLGHPAAHAGLFATDLGTAAPPGSLGGYTLTPFSADPQPLFSDVSSVATPIGGSVGFSTPFAHYQVDIGWIDWSKTNSYSGDIYATNGPTSATLALPSSTGAFYFYAEPNSFVPFNITAKANDGTSLTLAVDGDGGARGFGFYAAPGESISSITVSSSVDFAVGQFGIARAAPEPTSLALVGLASVTLAGYCGWRRTRKA